jgi:choloylglycine hydrolase
MDLDTDLDSQIIVIPKGYRISFKREKAIKNQYKIIGVGLYVDNYPLLFDAMNEKGLAVASLNFKGYAKYKGVDRYYKNYAPYELIPLLLSSAKNVREAKEIIKTINIVDIDFSKSIKNTPLHFAVSDKNNMLVIEVMSDGIHLYDNPYHVLTNNPPFPYQEINLSSYLHLTNETLSNNLLKELNITPYSNGLDAFSLPGDYSSTSRFVKTVFVNHYLDKGRNERENVLGFFMCLSQVSMPKGSVKTGRGYEYTRYTSCMNLENGKLYIRTYEDPTIKVYDMHSDTLKSGDITTYQIQNEFIPKAMN